jgi:SAM-dependent methyltransferase
MGKAELEERISNAHYSLGSEFERSSKIFTRKFVSNSSVLKILDVGCGTGLNAQKFADQGHSVVGIDLSPVAIEKFNLRGFKGLVCDVERVGGVPLADATFDLVFASEVIEHLVETESFLREVHRLLRPGGTLVLSTPNSSFWAYRLLGLLGYTPNDLQHPGHVRFFSLKNLSHQLKGVGFKIDKISARHMYMILGRKAGDFLAPLIKHFGFTVEPRFATGSHFWQLSSFADKASGFWSDTLIFVAHKS